jgi:hypothetical protein
MLLVGTAEAVPFQNRVMKQLLGFLSSFSADAISFSYHSHFQKVTFITLSPRTENLVPADQTVIGNARKFCITSF